MKRFMRTFTYIILSIVVAFSASAYDEIRFHCDSDTTIINDLLKSPELANMSKQDQMVFFAKKLIGSESNLRQEILEADTAIFTINIHAFNPLSLLSTCVALVKAYETSSAPNWRDYADKYENVMYKGGKAGDFASYFLYPSDWIADNIFRGNIIDATQRIDGLNIKRREKSIFYISSHKDAFKALANPANLDRIKMLEMGFRNHQITYIANGDLTNTSRLKNVVQDGDIIFLLTPEESLDSRVMGILFHDGDQLRLIHISPLDGTVIIDPLPFDNYVRRNIKRINGARLMRLER